MLSESPLLGMETQLDGIAVFHLAESPWLTRLFPAGLGVSGFCGW